MWQDTWSDKGTTIQGVQEYTLEGLKCGTKYSLRMTASNSVGSSQPAYVDATTLGGGETRINCKNLLVVACQKLKCQ